jgi:hypothetical protein
VLPKDGNSEWFSANDTADSFSCKLEKLLDAGGAPALPNSHSLAMQHEIHDQVQAKHSWQSCCSIATQSTKEKALLLCSSH